MSYLYVRMINDVEYFHDALECFVKGVIDADTYNKVSRIATQSRLQYYTEYVKNNECECKPDGNACQTCVAANWIKDYNKGLYND